MNTSLTFVQVQNGPGNAQDYSICKTILVLLSTMLDVANLISICKSRHQLNRVELYILNVIFVFTLNNKLISTLSFFKIVQLRVPIFFLLSTSYFSHNMALFYYAILHLITLNRSECFLQKLLAKLVNNSTTFLNYFIVNYLISASLTISYLVYQSYFIQPKTIEHPYIGSILLVIEATVSSFLPVLVYLLAILVLYKSRSLHPSEYLDLEEKLKFGEDLISMFKFLAFNVFNFIAILLQTLFNIKHIASKGLETDQMNLSFNFGYFMFIFEPIILVYVHVILRSEFKSLTRDERFPLVATFLIIITTITIAVAYLIYLRYE